MKKGRRPVKLPPTRNHRQLAVYVNTHRLFNEFGQQVRAWCDPLRVNTDRYFKGSRIRWPGKGRPGLLLTIRVDGGEPWAPDLFRHNSGEAYRRHREAREWVEKNLYTVVTR